MFTHFSFMCVCVYVCVCECVVFPIPSLPFYVPFLPFNSLSFHYRGMSEAKEKIKNGKDVPRRFSKEDGGWERLLIDLAATNPSFKGKREGKREGEKTAELEITL